MVRSKQANVVSLVLALAYIMTLIPGLLYAHSDFRMSAAYANIFIELHALSYHG